MSFEGEIKRDPDFINAEIALKRAARKARQLAQQAGIGVIVLQDGQIIEERPEDALEVVAHEIGYPDQYGRNREE